MRRLSFLFLAFALALFAQHLLAEAENFTTYILRDSLILSTLAALIFAFNLPVWPPQPESDSLAPGPLSLTSNILIGTGLICALLGGLGGLFIGGGALSSLLLILWILGIALFGVGAWRIQRTQTYSPPAYRWGVDAAGKYVRLALGDEPEAALAPDSPLFASPLWLLFVIGIAAFLRLWQLTSLPPDCIATECSRALALIEGSGTAAPALDLFQWITNALYAMTQQGLLSLRLTSALIGIATVHAFYLAARQITRSGGALLATVLLAANAWHIWASRSADPWIVLPLLFSLIIWAGLSVTARPRRLLPLIALLIALPVLIATLRTGALWQPSTDQPAVTGFMAVLIHLLGRGAGNGMALFADQPLLDGLTAALVVVGLGALVRYWRRLDTGVVLATFILLLIAASRVDFTSVSTSALLLLLPLLLLAAALALDGMVGLLQQTWAILIRPARLAATVLVLLLILGVYNALGLLGQMGALTSGGDNAADVAMGRFLAEQVRTPLVDTTIFVSANVLASSSTRLLAGSAIETAQVRTLDSALDYIAAGAANGNLLYLIPLGDQELLTLLQQIHSPSISERKVDEQSGEPLFTTLQVPAATVDAGQGLLELVFAGNDFGDASQAIALDTAGPLQFDWPLQSNLTTPFSVQWQGTLLVPTAGVYGFAVDMDATDGAVFSLRLDNRIVLDTSLSQATRQETLAKGFYRIDLSFRSAIAPTARPPAPLTVRWQRPGGEMEIIPRTVLHKPALPNSGLLGTYFAGTQWQGPALDRRKDLLVGLTTDLPMPYSVIWQGKLAASRAGEYRIAALGAGLHQVSIDNVMLIDNSFPAPEGVDPNYTESVIYLTQGWHSIEVRHVPDAKQPGLKLLWQPPGSNPVALSGAYLTPELADLALGDLPLPPAPPLLDSRLGNDAFALTQSTDLWQPQARILPANLRSLPFENLWQAGNGCGSGADQLHQPHGIALDGVRELIYVADTANRRVQVYSLAGVANAPLQSDLFQEPFDLVVTTDGALLVLDATAQLILRRAPGEESFQPLPVETSFYHPRGFTVDPMGTISVADTGGGRVVMLAPTGQVLAEFGGPDTPLSKGQAVDVLAVSGGLWAVTAEDGRLWRLDNGGSLTVLPRVDTLNGPHLAGLPDGSFFLSDPARRTVLYYAPTGEPRGQFAISNAFVAPTGIAVAQIDEFVYLTVADSLACTLSSWRMPLAELMSGS